MLKSISLHNFRIHKSTDISPIGNFCALVGKNDVGKSSVLQALDMLLKGESPSWDDRQNKDTGITIEASIDGTVYNKNPENINCHYFTAENFSDASIEDYTISELINSKEDISFALQRANKFKEDLDKIFEIYRNVNEVESELDLFLSRYGSDEDIDTAKIKRVNDIIDNFLELRDVNILACDDNLQEIEQCEYLTQGIDVDQEIYHQIVNDIEDNVNYLNVPDPSDLYSKLVDFVGTGDSSIIYDLDDEDIEDEYGKDIRVFVGDLKKMLDKTILAGRINITDIGFFNQFPNYGTLLLEGSLVEILNNQDKVMADVDAFIRTYLDRDIVTMWSMILRELGKTSTDIKIVKRGSGVKRLCSLFNYAVEKYRSVSVDGRQTIFAIDEPEISLHPNQQRELIKVLKEISNFPNIQVLITTHSPYVVKQLQEDNIVVLKEDNGIIKSDPMRERLITSYFSLNEINYLAFEEASIEYHQELLNKIEYEWAKMSTGGLMKDIVWAVSKYDTGVSNYIADLVANFKADYGEIINPYKGNEYHWQDNDKILYDECICSCVRNAIDHTWEGNEHWKSQKYVELSLKIMIAVAPKMKIVIDSVVNNLTNANWVSLDGGTKKYNINGETIKRPKCKFLRKIHKFFFKKDILFRNKNYCIVFKYKYPERTIWDDKERELDRVTMADVYKALSNSTNLFK